MSMHILGLDIGGANIKLSDADGNTSAVAFAMWTDYEQLSTTLKAHAAEFDTPDMIALTMTAELADCFESKQQGVDFVIDAVENAFHGIPVRVWLTTGEFAEPDDARELASLVAAANWHALATWIGRAVPAGPAILIDVGSTTTDIIPLIDGRPVPTGLTDMERLISGELVYSGVGRTPACAIVQSVPLRDQPCPVAAESFATIADALLVCEMLDEDPMATDTADGRAFTRPYSLNRLAHLLCCDATELTEGELFLVAETIVDQAIANSVDAMTRVYDGLCQLHSNENTGVESPAILLSGSGAFFADFVVGEFGVERFSDRMYLPEMFHKAVSESACAFAVARLAHDRCRDDLLQVSAF